MPLLRRRPNICFEFLAIALFLQILLGLIGSRVIADSLDSPKVLSIDGADSLVVWKNDVSRTVKAGSPLELGDKIATQGRTAAVIQYSDGSTVTISPDSEFQVEDKIDGIQWNRLKKGSVRGLITKPPIPISRAKFLIRTRSAVLGVRGTDFVMGLDSLTNTAQVHTLEGSVEVAPNEEALLKGEGKLVNEGKFVNATSGKIEVPDSFNREDFIKSYNSEMPTSSQIPASVGGGAGGVSAGGRASALGATTSGGKNLRLGLSAANGSTGTGPVESLKFPSHSLNNFKVEDRHPSGEKSATADEPKVPEKPSRFRLLNFRLGGFYSVVPDGTQIRAVNVAWTPTLPVPLIPFLIVRGNFGVVFARDGSLYSQFLINEYQVFLNLNLFDRVFIEGGTGEQIWKSVLSLDGQLWSVNAGILLSNSVIKCIYLGYQYLDITPRFDQFKAGIELFVF